MEGATSNALTAAVTTAATTVKTDFLAAAGDIAPIAIGIAGAFIVVTLAWKFFKRLAH